MTSQKRLSNDFGRGLTQKVVLSLLNLNQKATDEVVKCDTSDFDIFKLREYTDGNELVSLLPFVLARRNVLGKTELDINKLIRFAFKIQTGYKNITYHNKTHGADLCQTINYFFVQGQLGVKAKIDEHEYLAMLTAACVHDFEHPGVNNVFLVKMQNPIAIRHND